MSYLEINKTTKLSDIGNLVGNRNVDTILHLNNLPRRPYVGQYLYENQMYAIKSSKDIDWQRKVTLLNTLVDNSDLFELAATGGEDTWKLLSSENTFKGMLKIPEYINLPNSTSVWGNNERISNVIYNKAMSQLTSDITEHTIDPSIFNGYSTIHWAEITDNSTDSDVFKYFKIPWGKVSLYSSISDTFVDFPVYPEEYGDVRKANFSEMPEMLYQYEPWLIYTSSGPNQQSYTFDFHRDMWTGDHRDGKANELVRFCQANCFPEYRGSAVNVPTVTLYLMGQPVIRGVMNEAAATWDGPIGLDGFYLHCKLTITITEVSEEPLNYYSVMNKALIG